MKSQFKKKSVLFLYTINEVLATEKCKKVPFIIGTKPHEKNLTKYEQYLYAKNY